MVYLGGDPGTQRWGRGMHVREEKEEGERLLLQLVTPEGTEVRPHGELSPGVEAVPGRMRPLRGQSLLWVQTKGQAGRLAFRS